MNLEKKSREKVKMMEKMVTWNMCSHSRDGLLLCVGLLFFFFYIIIKYFVIVHLQCHKWRNFDASGNSKHFNSFALLDLFPAVH